VLVNPSAGATPAIAANYHGSRAEADASAHPAFDPSFAFQQVDQQAFMPQTDLYDQRARDIDVIQTSVQEVGTLLGKLATVVHEQGDMFSRIDDDVTTTLLNLEAGEKQLWKKHDSLSYKWLAVKVFAILFLFAVLFMLFIA
jgi:hypothetical protein